MIDIDTDLNQGIKFLREQRRVLLGLRPQTLSAPERATLRAKFAWESVKDSLMAAQTDVDVEVAIAKHMNKLKTVWANQNKQLRTER